MIIVSLSKFHVNLPVNACLAYCLNSVLNVKVLVRTFNQEKALLGAFSVITNLRMDLFEALVLVLMGHYGPVNMGSGVLVLLVTPAAPRSILQHY